jgi:deferrochelatase/peroxidase EfeB
MVSTRRAFLSAAGAAAVAAAAAGTAADRIEAEADTRSRPDGGGVVPFFGRHQAGIATPTQEHLTFVAFDLVSDSRGDLRGLLQAWSAAASNLTRGELVGSVETGTAPPVDTGEAIGLGPARLTVTFGIGPAVFAPQRGFGLSTLRPAALVDLPAFPGVEALQASISGGDLAVQACADDPQVAFHAVHDLIRTAGGVAVPRWLLSGFGRTGNTSDTPTPRNFMGFKDGTNNIPVDDQQALTQFVWIGSEAPAWMQGGSYMVVRRVEMLLGAWDATALNDQERTFGRRKVSGAPLTGVHERDPLRLDARVNGLPVIPGNAHIRLASPTYNDGQQILRRGYSYVDGIDGSAETVAGGLLFICYQRDPRTQFIPIQRRLAAADALNRHILHVGSAIFACPPGAGPGGFVGDALFT